MVSYPPQSPVSFDKPMDEPPENRPAGGNLRYVSDMLLQLKVVSGREGGPFLAYLLELARAEAIERLTLAGAQPASDTLPSE